MKKTIAILLAALFLIGCNEKAQESKKEIQPEAASQPSWATANFDRIYGAIFKIAKEQNPFPNSDINENQIRYKKQEVSTLIGEVIAEKCGHTPDNPILKLRRRHKASLMSEVDPRCHAIINTDPLFQSLISKRNALEEQSRELSEHNIKIKTLASAETKKLIADYSDEKFEIVVGNDNNNILYNKSGITIDVTDGLINSIDPSRLFFGYQETKDIENN